MTSPRRLWRLYRAGTTLLRIWDTGRATWARRRAATTLPAYLQPQWWAEFLAAARELALIVGLPEEIEMAMLKGNWKTTAAGLSTILAVVAKVISTGQVDWQVDGPAIITAIGLIVAKDAGKGDGK